MTNENLITLANGKLAWLGDFPTDKRELSELMTILTEDYVKHGGVITKAKSTR